jgi:GAF domain-containing protein
MMNLNSPTPTNTLRYALIGAGFGVLFPVFATILRFLTLGQSFSINSIVLLHTSDPLLWIIDTAPVVLGSFASLVGARQDRLVALNQEFQKKNLELEKAQATLEQRVQERTLALEEQAGKFQFVAEAARRITAVQDLDSLLGEIISLVTVRFKQFQTTVYLLKYEKDADVLVMAHTDSPQQTERILLDTNTIAGAAALLGEMRIVPDMTLDATHLERIGHPEAHSEIAIPLRVREESIGVLHIQSPHKNDFDEGRIDVLTALANQVASGINDTRLYHESKTALAEAQATIEQYVQMEWKNFNQSLDQSGYMYDGRQILPLTSQTQLPRSRTIAQTGSLSLDKSSAYVTVPIKLRGQAIGVLEVRPKKGKRDWTDDELSLLEAAADRAAFALENARLVNGAQRRAARERAIGEISSKIGAISDRNIILQTTVEELGRRIGNTEIVIELESPSEVEGSEKA